MKIWRKIRKDDFEVKKEIEAQTGRYHYNIKLYIGETGFCLP